VTDEPDFRELVGEDVPAGEEARLRRVHELLLAAGPPEELPPSLAAPPRARPGGGRAEIVPFPSLPRRRLGATLVLAAALAAGVFGGGYWLGSAQNAFHYEETFTMHGPAPGAFASVRMAARDGASNWPLELHVQGLSDLPKGGYYELLLSRDGRPGPSCGSFRTHAGRTTIVLNAPYPLKRWNGWIVVAHVPGRKTSGPILTTGVA
jgi:hypothetical protein